MSRNLFLKTRHLIHKESRLPFFKRIDLFAVEDGTLIGVTGALSRGFRLEGCDLLLKSPEDIDDFERRMRIFLNGLPEGLTLHFITRSETGDEDMLAEYERSVKPAGMLAEKLIRAKVEAYRRNPFYKNEIFLFVVMHPRWRKSRPSVFPDLSLSFGKKARRLTKYEYGKMNNRLRETAKGVTDGFVNLGFKVAPLSDVALLSHLYEFLNPDCAREIIPFDEDMLLRTARKPLQMSLRSTLLLSPPVAEDRFFYLDRFFHEAVGLYQLPEATDLKSMKDFEQGLRSDYFLSATIQVPDQEQIKAEIKRQGYFSRAHDFFSPGKQHDALASAGETEELLTTVAESSDKLFYLWFSVLLKEKAKRAVERRAREVLRIFPRLGGARGIEDHMNHDRIFLSFLPLQGDDSPLPLTVRTEALTHLLPLQRSWKGTEKMGLLLKTYRNEPLKLDLFDPALPAKHGIMLGSTGSGKSFLTTHLLTHFLIESRNHEVIVIDLGGSYKKLAEALGGFYLEVECTESYALNPFPKRGTLFSDDEMDADATFLQFLRELLQRMIASRHNWRPSEKMILERAIREVYKGLERDQAPLLGDIEQVLRKFSFGDEEDRGKAYRFAKELSLYTEGEYGKILNRQGVFDMDASFTVFDLRKISHYPELQEVLFLIIPFALKRKFENLKVEKILVLDECWKLLKESQGTELVEGYYRTARKLNAGVLSISQNPEDFLEASIASVIVNNSPVKYILPLKRGFEKLNLFEFNKNEIRAVRELTVRPGFYSEAFIKFDTRAVIAKLEPSALEYWLATTDAADAAEEENLRSAPEKRSGFEILEELADRYPHGVRRGKESQHA